MVDPKEIERILAEVEQQRVIGIQLPGRKYPSEFTIYNVRQLLLPLTDVQTLLDHIAELSVPWKVCPKCHGNPRFRCDPYADMAMPEGVCPVLDATGSIDCGSCPVCPTCKGAGAVPRGAS